MTRQKKTGRRLLAPVLLLTALALLIACAALLAVRHPTVPYLARDWMSHLFRGEMPERCETVELTQWPLEALLEDPRVTVDESMLLIDQEHPIPEGRAFAIGTYRETDVQMNECVMQPYSDLAQQVLDQYGTRLYIRSAYRTAEEQQKQMEEEGSGIAAAVGESEHQAGLALDLYVSGYAGKGFLNSEEGRYVNSYCWRQGFIVRYPYYGVRETGIEFEPWHLRYVGQPHAEIISENALTLEGYFDWYELDVWYQYGEYYVSHQDGGETLTVPEHFSELNLSEDNLGGWWLTARTD